MEYYAMKTEEGATLYFDRTGMITDINIPDGIETITFSGEDGYSGRCNVCLESVMKQFPDVKEIKIKPSIIDIDISNEMFPNVQKVTSENVHFKSGPLLMYRYSGSKDKYLLHNTFCQKPGTPIDLKNVSQIKPYAFSGCLSTNIVNSNMVDNVDKNAFAGSLFIMPSYEEPIIMAGSVLVDVNPNASEVYIGKNVSHISYYADFSNVKKIHLDRFKNRNKLYPTSYPDGCELFIDEVEKTPVYDFTKMYRQSYGGNNFSNFHINKENKFYKTVDGILYSKDGKSLILCPRGKDGAVSISEGTEYICEMAFSGCHLSEVKFPDSLKEIGAFAFENCENLTSIDFGNGINHIGSESENNIFRACGSLKEICIPPQVKAIGNMAFACCNNLKTVELHDGLVSIGAASFMETAIDSLFIPASVERIGENAMNGIKDIKVEKSGHPFGLISAIAKDSNLESNIEKLSDIIGIDYEDEGILYVPMYMTNENINRVNSEISVYGYNDDLAGRTYEMGVNSDVKQNIAIQIYQYTKNADIAAYLKRVSTTISRRLLRENKEEQLIEFIRAGLMTKNALKRTLEEANRLKATSVSAYILSTMDDDTSKTSFRL